MDEVFKQFIKWEVEGIGIIGLVLFFVVFFGGILWRFIKKEKRR